MKFTSYHRQDSLIGRIEGPRVSGRGGKEQYRLSVLLFPSFGDSPLSEIDLLIVLVMQGSSYSQG